MYGDCTLIRESLTLIKGATNDRDVFVIVCIKGGNLNPGVDLEGEN